MNLKWEDSLAIAITLDDTHPGVDPRRVSLVELQQWVCELEEFDDDPRQSNEKLLEAIKAAWIEERE